jgi:hypothetical protein
MQAFFCPHHPGAAFVINIVRRFARIAQSSFCNSPSILGAPQWVFSWTKRRIKPRTSCVILGRPPRGRDFQRPVEAEAGPMPTHHRFGD